MRGRRSSRSAAVVLAGCVGLAVMAPGIAMAAPVAGATTEAECKALGYSWVDGVCDDDTAAGSTVGDTESGSETPGGSGESSVVVPGVAVVPQVEDEEQAPASTEEQVPASTEQQVPGTTEQQVPGTTEQQVPGTTEQQVSGTTEQQVSGTTEQQVSGTTEQQVPGTTEQQVPASTEQLASAEEVESATADLQEEVDKVLPEAGPNPIGLPNLPTIPQPVDGTFENVNDACLNAISKLQFPAGTTGLENLSTQLQSFCHGLDTTDVHVCLDHLRDVLRHLCPGLTEHHTTINVVTTNVSNEWWGAYWHHRYDVDCDELTYDEANAILDWDRSDPFRLDRDDDGVACEASAHDDETNADDEVEYVSYPEGGVSTGDGSTSSGASPVELALAAGALGGLGATGLVLVRRYARQG